MRDYIHILMTEAQASCVLTYMIPYERCYLGTNDTMICQCFNEGEARTYKIPKDVNGPGSLAPLSSLDSCLSISPIVVVSPVSRRVAVAFLKPAVFGTADYCGIPGLHRNTTSPIMEPAARSEQYMISAPVMIIKIVCI
jgi:hypothetical protein